LIINQSINQSIYIAL